MRSAAAKNVDGAVAGEIEPDLIAVGIEEANVLGGCGAVMAMDNVAQRLAVGRAQGIGASAGDTKVTEVEASPERIARRERHGVSRVIVHGAGERNAGGEHRIV